MRPTVKAIMELCYQKGPALAIIDVRRAFPALSFMGCEDVTSIWSEASGPGGKGWVWARRKLGDLLYRPESLELD